MTLRPLMALVRKDLLVFWSDRYAVVLSFVAPIGLASFMALIFGGAGPAEPAKIAVRLADRDGSAVSRAIVARAKGDPALAVAVVGAEEGDEAVRTGRAVVSVTIPDGFAATAARAAVGAIEPPILTFVGDPTRRSDLSMARGLLTGHVAEAIAAGSPGAGPGGFRAPFLTRERPITGGADGERKALAAHAFASMVVQFVLFSAIEWGINLIQERRRGIAKRWRAAPVARATVLASKAIGSGIVSIAITGAVLGSGAIAFGYRIGGDPFAFGLVGVGFALTASAFGLLVASAGGTPQAARSISILVVLVMVLLGGGWIPGFLFPRWLQAVTVAVPTRWAIDGLDGVLSRGYTLAEASPAILALAGFTVAFGLAALALGSRAARRDGPVVAD